MRSVEITGRGETRDCVQDSWWAFLEKVGVTPILLPNHKTTAARILDDLPIGGLLLTGGGSIGAITGCDGPRDIVEDLAIIRCLRLGAPILGVCRGMQKIVAFFGGAIAAVQGHVAAPHGILGDGIDRLVNSFHDYGCNRVPPGFIVRARSAGDHSPEWIELASRGVTGIMWHPERNTIWDQEDILLFRRTYLGEYSCAV